MKTDIYWIETDSAGQLGIMPRPRGDDWLADEIRGWQTQGVNRVVSLLTPGEISELGLAREAEFCKQEGIAFVSYPIPDMTTPSSSDALDVLGGITAAVESGETVAIHCRAGIGRSGMMACSVLVQQGMSPDAAMDHVSAARGVTVPETPDQIAWVRGVESRRDA